jgi:aminotransferase
MTPGHRSLPESDRLRQAGVACVPGEAFYHDEAGDHPARFCFAKEDAVLYEACTRIKRGTYL